MFGAFFGAASPFAVVRAVLVWLAVALLVWVLYQSGAGGADAPAIAEAREHRLGGTEPGTLAELLVQPGQRVKRGDVLARFDTAELDDQIRVLRAELDRTGSAAEAGAVALAAGAFGDERTLAAEAQAARQAEAAERATQARDQAELAAVRAALRDEQAVVARGLARNDRLQELAAREQVLAEQARAGAGRVAAAAARSAQAQARLAQWRQRFGPAAAGQPQAAQLQPLRAAVQEREAALQSLRARRERLAVKAPVDGLVTALAARSGDVLRVGDPVLVLTETVPHQAVAYVAERHRLHVQAGQRVAIRRSGGSGGTWSQGALMAEVQAVSQAVTPLPSRLAQGPQSAGAGWGREVYIALPPDAGLTPGELLEVRFLEPNWAWFSRPAAAAASAVGR